MEGSSLRHRQINEKLARVVDQLEICMTMTWFGMVANAMSANSPGSLSTKLRLVTTHYAGQRLTAIWMQMHRIIDVFVTFR